MDQDDQRSNLDRSGPAHRYHPSFWTQEIGDLEKPREGEKLPHHRNHQFFLVVREEVALLIYQLG
jgi:hypothetical protein